MRIKTTKEAEKRAFEKLSTRSILIGVTKVLWKRHRDVVLMALAPLELAIIIWIKLGK